MEFSDQRVCMTYTFSFKLLTSNSKISHNFHLKIHEVAHPVIEVFLPSHGVYLHNKWTAISN